MSGWDKALTTLGACVGDTFKGGAYRLDTVNEDKRRLEFVRVAKGSRVNVGARLLNRCWSATAGKGSLSSRAPGPDGISYTVTVEFMVVTALGLTKGADGRWIRGNR
mgnify:CR=1 FL=1